MKQIDDLPQLIILNKYRDVDGVLKWSAEIVGSYSNPNALNDADKNGKETTALFAVADGDSLQTIKANGLASLKNKAGL